MALMALRLSSPPHPLCLPLPGRRRLMMRPPDHREPLISLQWHRRDLVRGVAVLLREPLIQQRIPRKPLRGTTGLPAAVDVGGQAADGFLEFGRRVGFTFSINGVIFSSTSFMSSRSLITESTVSTPATFCDGTGIPASVYDQATMMR